MIRFTSFICALFACGFAHLASAIELPSPFAEGMVLQRDTAVTIRGRTPADGAIVARLNGAEIARAESANGAFELTLPPQSAGGPHLLSLHGPESEVSLPEVLFGEVWFASGQSNMELPIARVRTLLGGSVDRTYMPLVRYFDVERKYQFDGPAEDVAKRPWLKAVPEDADAISALVFFFARELHQHLQVPIGIIDASFGGTTAEGWLSREALSAFPKHLERLEQLAQPGYVEQVKAADAEREAAWQARLAELDQGMTGATAWYKPEFDHSQWQVVNLPGLWAEVGLTTGPTVHWARQRVELPANLAGLSGEIELSAIIDADEVWINGEQVGSTGYRWPPRRYRIPLGVLQAGPNTIAVRVVSRGAEGGILKDKPMALRVAGNHFNLAGPWRVALGAELPPPPAQQFTEHMQPGGFFNAMVAPLTDVPVAGVIWYQGESNVGRAEEYRQLMAALISDWRGRWGAPQLPFLQVQLAGFLPSAPLAPSSAWAELRAAQRHVANVVPNVAAVPAYDVGEWNDIHPLDKETPAKRLALAARRLAYNENTLVMRGPALATALPAEGGAVLQFAQLGAGLAVKGGSQLRGFTAVAADGTRHPAPAHLEGNKVRLEFPAGLDIVAVTYAWDDNPEGANLVNLEGWPAEPFWFEL